VSNKCRGEADGRFYQGCDNYINVYDRTQDDFDSLRRKSVFGLTAVMMVGARVRDGGGTRSASCAACVEATKRMGRCGKCGRG